MAVDNDYAVWRAFSNHYWPAAYIADAEGRLRYHHFGEGEYAMSEMVIQQLLLEAGATDVDQDLVFVEPRGLEVAADWATLQSPETYLGYAQSTGFASQSRARLDRHTTTLRHRSCPSTTGTSPAPGRSPSTPRSSTSRAGGSRSSSTRAIVNLVMGPAPEGKPIRSAFSSTAGPLPGRRDRRRRRGHGTAPTSAATS